MKFIPSLAAAAISIAIFAPTAQASFGDEQETKMQQTYSENSPPDVPEVPYRGVGRR